ncbi:PHOsphatase [Halocaridina rubra]|uniref:Multiple inositol polyphosphate phosphatase 1 n=1 Tax=Halocaridina rubra TaxID=373956 RepID=A0AAN8ZZB5_HALRR
MDDSVWIMSVCVLALSLNGRSIGFRLKEKHYCLSDDINPYLKFATKTGYNLQRGTLDPESLAPEGCEPIQFWHLLRHGTRYPSRKDIAAFGKLPDLQRRILEADSELCDGDLEALRRWSLGGLNETWNYIQTPEGDLELLELAGRFKNAIPTLLGKPFSNDSFKFRHTKTQRTEASARAYAKGLFGEESDMVYMPRPLDPDPLIKFYDVCSKYQREVKDKPEALEEAKLFAEGPEVAAMVARMSKRLGISLTLDYVETLYDACRFYKAWMPSEMSVWCAAFTPDDLKIMEYCEDLEYYYESGYGHVINYESACPMMKDLLLHLSNAVDGRSVPSSTFYFGHSGALQKMMARLGLYKDAIPLTHEGFEQDRLWRTSRHGIFTTNLAFTLSKCTGEREFWVTLMVNEMPVQIPGCPDTAGCSWQDFMKIYGQYENCDFDVICENEKEYYSSSGSLYYLHFLTKAFFLLGNVPFLWS